MKKMLLLFISILTWASTMAQISDSIPHKHDMYIHIVTADSNEVAYKSLGRYFVDNDFPIASSDREFLSMRTEFKDVSLNAFQMETIAYQITIRGHEIKIKILNSFPGLGISDVNYLNNGSIMARSWKAGIGLLTRIPHTRIYYTQR